MSFIHVRAWFRRGLGVILLAGLIVGTIRTCQTLGANADAAPPRLAVKEREGVAVVSEGGAGGLVVTIAAGDTWVDRAQSAEVVIANEGAEPLQVSLERVSCECIRAVTCDGRTLGIGQTTTIHGQPAALRIAWRVDREEVRPEQPPRMGRLIALLRTNHPWHQTVRIEIITRLVAGDP